MNLQDIYDQKPCTQRWGHLLTGLGHGDFLQIKSYRETKGKFPGGQEISLGDVAVLNDAADATWCVRAMPWEDIAVRRRFVGAVLLPMCERMAVHATDGRVDNTIAEIRRWCDGDDTVDLIAAKAATWEAVIKAKAATWEVAGVVWAAARVATGDAKFARTAVVGVVGMAGVAGREHQRRDIIAAYPPLVVKEKSDG